MSNDDLVKRLRNAKAYIPEYDFHGNEINVDVEDTLYQEAANRVEYLESALRQLDDMISKLDAELIIKECTSMLEKEMNEAYGARGDGLADAIEMINKHFGVK